MLSPLCAVVRHDVLRWQADLHRPLGSAHRDLVERLAVMDGGARYVTTGRDGTAKCGLCSQFIQHHLKAQCRTVVRTKHPCNMLVARSTPVHWCACKTVPIKLKPGNLPR